MSGVQMGVLRYDEGESKAFQRKQQRQPTPLR